MIECIGDSFNHKAKFILYNFLRDTAVNFKTQQCFIHYYLVIEHLQEAWKAYQKAKSNRMKFLVFRWDFEVENMIEY